jgi:hypothetical protein
MRLFGTKPNGRALAGIALSEAPQAGIQRAPAAPLRLISKAVPYTGIQPLIFFVFLDSGSPLRGVRNDCETFFNSLLKHFCFRLKRLEILLIVIPDAAITRVFGAPRMTVKCFSTAC